MDILRKIFNIIKINFFGKENTDEAKFLASQLLVRDNKEKTFQSLYDAEFKVFSQWGEDGIIQYLINKLPIKNKVFIEFGVANYKESNTRFLLMNNNWSGLVIDGSLDNISYIKNSDLYWKYDLVARSFFITKENIDPEIKDFITTSDFNKKIGLLSIDIDGNDYHVWETITCIDPVIVICEYNWIFGNKHKLTVPYDKKFIRTQKHYSNLYFGASIQALYSLAKQKGYEYIGCTSAGNDAFFVKKEYAQKYLRELITTPEITFKKQKAKESRDENGNLTFIRGYERFHIIEEMEILDLQSNQIKKLNSVVV